MSLHLRLFATDGLAIRDDGTAVNLSSRPIQSDYRRYSFFLLESLLHLGASACAWISAAFHVTSVPTTPASLRHNDPMISSRTHPA